MDGSLTGRCPRVWILRGESADPTYYCGTPLLFLNIEWSKKPVDNVGKNGISLCG